MSPTVTLQTPHLSDYPELVRVWEASVRATHTFLPDRYIVLLREHVLRKYLDAVMLVCCKDSRRRILGFAGVANGRVDMLFVAPDYRGQGVGRRLLRHAVSELNAERLDVNEQNPRPWASTCMKASRCMGARKQTALDSPIPYYT